eukprot:TRINITY_DN6573_c0_g2_i1.p1 TRINITY_DN6573_c0_g2~~TRINITY_DN6573_c0_g2_i1.p1  ORF type:complete len:152 (+),score=21.40 TRINITY_DN6573_c0_g2_i1:25-456(+)
MQSGANSNTIKIDLSDTRTQQALLAAGKVAATAVTKAPLQIVLDKNKEQPKQYEPRQQYFVYKYKYGDPESEKQYELAIGCGTTWCLFFLGFCCFPFWFLGAVMGSKLQRGSPVERSGFVANLIACTVFIIFGIMFVLNRFLL